MVFDPQTYLESLDGVADSEVDLALAALCLAAKAEPVVNFERYQNHLKKLGDEVGVAHADFLKAGAEDDVGTRLAALKQILAEKHGYTGDEERYDDIENASLIRAIDRGKAMPITLCILYIHAARAQGWDIAGLDIPGHFACRIEKDGQRLIFDPFQHCKVLEAPDLRALIKKVRGPHAELSNEYFEPTSNRAVLIRLQNNIKFRQIEMEDYEGALLTVDTMRLVDPQEYRLLLDAGVLYARTNRTEAAIDALEEYIKLAPQDRDRHDAALLLQQLKERLH